MSGPKRIDDRTWARFFEFVADADEPTLLKDVEADLADEGVDTKRATATVLKAIRKARARAALEQAARLRPLLMEHVAKTLRMPLVSARDQLLEIINRKFAGPAQAAFCRRLEDVSSEQDLRTLLQDLETLASLEEERPSGQADGE